MVSYFEKNHKLKNTKTLLPTFGILIFIVLYLVASQLYPGGSQADLNSIGFDWMHNYWCNLLNEKGMNGLKNPARPIAITAMIILCSSILLFFYQFARYFAKNTFWKRIIKIAGTLSMLTAALLFTEYHDLMTILSSIFGLFVLIGIIYSVYKSEMTFFKISGIIGIILLAINNYIYYSLQFIELLPLIQKGTFVFILFWIIGLNLKMIENII